MKGAVEVARAVYQQESMFSPTGLVWEPIWSGTKKVKNDACSNQLIQPLLEPGSCFN